MSSASDGVIECWNGVTLTYSVGGKREKACYAVFPQINLYITLLLDRMIMLTAIRQHEKVHVSAHTMNHVSGHLFACRVSPPSTITEVKNS